MTVMMLLMKIFICSIIIGCIQVAGIPLELPKILPQDSVCPTGMGGKNCLDINCSAGNPCHNGGVCKPSKPSDFCSCAKGWSGPQCGDVDCKSFVCETNTVCKEVKGAPVCVCTIKNNQGGSQEVINCTDVNSFTHGMCAYSSGLQICMCDDDYFEQNCEYKPCNKDSNKCENGGVCRIFVDTMDCVCPPNTEGKNCEKCNLNCVHGKCIYNKTKDELFCQCSSGFTSTLCDKEIPKEETNCSKTQCNGNGNCIDDKSNECSCLIQYTGEKCEKTCAEFCPSKKCTIKNRKSICEEEVHVDDSISKSQLNVALGVGIFFIIFVILCFIIGFLVYRYRFAKRRL